MTLIQTLLTPKFVIQVSDRRLTALRRAIDGKYHRELYDDKHNKAVSWCGYFTAGFTGFAFTDRDQTKPVSEWIAGILAPLNNTTDAVMHLKNGAEKLARRVRDWQDPRISIVLAGIAPGYDYAYFVCVSNFDTLKSIHTEAADRFVYNQRTVALEGNLTKYIPVGALLKDQAAEMARQLPRIAQFGGINNAARYMVRIQRQVAKRDTTVGEDAMVVTIPVNPAMPYTIFSNTANDAVTDKTADFSFVKAGGFSRERFGPIFACGGRAITTWASGDTDGNQQSEIRYLPVPPR